MAPIRTQWTVGAHQYLCQGENPGSLPKFE